MAKTKAASKKITIYPDRTYDPPTGVVINPGGEVQFDVEFPPGMNTCKIPFGKITFSYSARVPKTASGTIKVGSG